MYNYSSTESETSSEEADKGKATGLSANQNRLLYLLDLHTKRAEDRDDCGLWIRKQALSVLIYEGIIKEVGGFDVKSNRNELDCEIGVGVPSGTSEECRIRSSQSTRPIGWELKPFAASSCANGICCSRGSSNVPMLHRQYSAE